MFTLGKERLVFPFGQTSTVSKMKDENKKLLQGIREGKGVSLGSGTFGMVSKYVLGDQAVAVKHIVSLREEDIAAPSGDHHNVLYRHVLDLPGRPCLKMPYCPLGNLNNDYVEQPKNLIETLLDMVQISNGLKYLHSVLTVHGNLKPENVLVLHENGCRVLKLTDYGMKLQGFDSVDAAGFGPSYGKVMAEAKAHAEKRTAMFAASECVTMSTPAGDVFSCGLLFMSLIPPTFESKELVPKIFKDGEWYLINDLVKNENFNTEVMIERFFKWNKDLGSTLMKMLEKESNNRPGIDHVVYCLDWYAVQQQQYVPMSWEDTATSNIANVKQTHKSDLKNNEIHSKDEGLNKETKQNFTEEEGAEDVKSEIQNKAEGSDERSKITGKPSATPDEIKTQIAGAAMEEQGYGKQQNDVAEQNDKLNSVPTDTTEKATEGGWTATFAWTFSPLASLWNMLWNRS